MKLKKFSKHIYSNNIYETYMNSYVYLFNLKQHPNILLHNNNRLQPHNIHRTRNNIPLPAFEVVAGHTLVVAVVDNIPVVGLVGSNLVVGLAEVDLVDNTTIFRQYSYLNSLLSFPVPI